MNNTFQDIDWSAFKGKRVCIYGGLGFIGWNLAREAMRKGAKVTIIDNLHNSTTDVIADVPMDDLDAADFQFVHGDARLVETHANAIEADVIIWACCTQISRAGDDPLYDLDVNARGFVEMCMVMREEWTPDEKARKRIIYTSSVSVFGQPENMAILHRSPFKPDNHYAVTKLAGEMQARLFMDDLPITVIRYSNVYGRGQTPMDNRVCGVIGKFIHAYLNGGEFEIYGNGNMTRDYTYIDDAVEFTLGCGIIQAAKSQTFNFGTGMVASVYDIADIIVQADPGKKPFRSASWPSRDIDTVRSRWVQMAVTRDITRWRRDMTTLSDGIRMTMEWYADEMNRRDGYENNHD